MLVRRALLLVGPRHLPTDANAVRPLAWSGLDTSQLMVMVSRQEGCMMSIKWEVSWPEQTKQDGAHHQHQLRGVWTRGVHDHQLCLGPTQMVRIMSISWEVSCLERAHGSAS